MVGDSLPPPSELEPYVLVIQHHGAKEDLSAPPAFALPATFTCEVGMGGLEWTGPLGATRPTSRGS